MIRRPPRSTRTAHSCPTRRSSDLNANAGLAHLAGRMGQHFMVVVELHAEHRVGQQLDNGTLEFQQIFLGHLSFLSNPPSRFIAPARLVSLAIPVPGFPLRFPAFAWRARGSSRKSMARKNTPAKHPLQRK